MFSGLLIVCTLDYVACQTIIDPNIHDTEEYCYNSLAEGMRAYESQGLVIHDYDCHQWKSSFFYEKPETDS